MEIERLKELWEQSTDKYGDARKMGSTYQTMYNIIYKGSVPKVDLLERIAGFYRKPIGYFFGEAVSEGAGSADQEREIIRLRAKVEAYENALRLLGHGGATMDIVEKKKQSV